MLDSDSEVEYTSTSTMPKRHPEYYLDDGDIIFFVDGVLFCVHRYFFLRESSTFRDMFTTTSSKCASLAGLSDDKPVVLENVESVDFARFLWFFYNREFGDYNTDFNGWCSILLLASKWQFEKVHAIAVKRLGECDCDPVKKIELCTRSNIDRTWITEAMNALVLRAEPLSVTEAEKVGYSMATSVSERRETAIRRELSKATQDTIWRRNELNAMKAETSALVQEIQAKKADIRKMRATLVEKRRALATRRREQFLLSDELGEALDGRKRRRET